MSSSLYRLQVSDRYCAALKTDGQRTFTVITLAFINITGKTSLHHFLIIIKNRDSSVGIVLGYRLDYRASRVRFPAGAGNFSLHHRVQNGSGAHPAPYPMGTNGSFPGRTAAKA
jgi:hypothetical protein